MAIKLQTTGDVRADGVKGVIYGKAGSGKTSLLGTASDCIVLASEPGLLSLVDKDVPFIEINSIKDVDEAYKWLTKSEESKQYQTVGMDSLTETAEVLLESLKPGEKDARQAYAKMAESAVAMIRNFRDIKGKNVIFNCKLKEKEDEDGNIIDIYPSMPGKLMPYHIPYQVDELLVARVDRKGRHYLQTKADRLYQAKDRSGKLDAEESMDLDALFRKIKGE